MLQVGRSFVPGILAGWIIWNMPEPLAPLELTVEADERISTRGEVVDPLDETSIRDRLTYLKVRGIEALTISLINSYADGAHERRIRKIAREIMPDVPVSISSEILPEMQEYERTLTTVANSYVAPVLGTYVNHLQQELKNRGIPASLNILRSDGGLVTAEAAQIAPVSILMSGPAGGVTGALWIAQQAGYNNLLTLDMGGTSTDVALIENGVPRVRRETMVGDVTVRFSSIDVRSVGAGGGSIAHVPELTRALRVGPESAGADPGPAAYGKGGDRPTVTDANLVLGRLPAMLADNVALDRSLAEKAVSTIGDALGLGIKQAASGIIDIVNENMFGALRLVSVQQGYDPREFALIAFGGAGPLHANALARLAGSWPVIIPPSPGVLCAYGDATTRMRNEVTISFIRRFSDTSNSEVSGILEDLADRAHLFLERQGVARSDQSTQYQIDVRYHGQGLILTVGVDMNAFRNGGLETVRKEFDEEHTQMFTFALPAEQEVVNLRAIALGPVTLVSAGTIEKGDANPAQAKLDTTSVFVENSDHEAKIYERAKLKAGNRVPGPAMITELDSTTLVLPGHVGEVDTFGNILIVPAS